MAKNNTDTQRPFDFEKAISELEGIVKQLEEGNTGLDKSIDLFQRGVELAKLCKQKLDQAEIRVKQLIREKDGVFSEGEIDAAKGDAPRGSGQEDVPKDQLDDIPF